MPVRTKIASLFYNAVLSEKISFHTAVKYFRYCERYFKRKKSPSERAASQGIIGHVVDATSPENQMAWTSVAFPAEILYPFNIYPLTLEVVAGLLSTLGLAAGFLDRSDSIGIPNTMCSFHRALIGLSETSFIGKPSLIGAASILCDGNLKSFSEAAKNQNVPFIFIDVPYEEDDAAIQYVKDQLRDAILKLGDISRKIFDKELFDKVVRNVNETFKYSRKFYLLRKDDYKNLYEGHEQANFAFPKHFMLGSDRLVDLTKIRCRDVESPNNYSRHYRMREFNKSAKRIMWLHIVPQYGTDMWNVIDNGVSAKIVCDEYSSPYYDDYDIDDPLGSIARRLINHPSNGPIERRIEHILRIAKDYNVDGMIHYSSWGCHQAAGNVLLLEKALSDAGYKFLNLNSDPIDQRGSSQEQHRTRLEAFLEGSW